MSKKKNNRIKNNASEIESAVKMEELSEMLNGTASVVKAVAMLNKKDCATVIVSSFDEQVVLPESVRQDIIDVLKRHVEIVKPYLSALAKSL